MPRLKRRPTEQRVVYRIGEVVSMTGLSRSTINRWLDAGVLDSFKVGDVRLITAGSFERVMRGETRRSRRKAPAPTPTP